MAQDFIHLEEVVFCSSSFDIVDFVDSLRVVISLLWDAFSTSLL